MIQQVIIRSEATISIKPLVEGAIQNELKTLAYGLKRTREQLATFEERFGMASEEFESRYNGGDLDETLDTIDWLMEIQALRLLQEEYNALREAHLD